MKPNKSVTVGLAEDGYIRVSCPYNRILSARFRNMRGVWNKEKSDWVFDDEIIEYVIDVLLETFGYDGSEPHDPVRLFVSGYSCSAQEICLFGRSILSISTKYNRTMLGEGVLFIDGECSVGRAGISLKNATLEIMNVDRSATKALPELAKAIEEGWVTIKEYK